MNQNKKFISGKTYYSLSFCDKNLTYPKIETLIYIGCNLSDEDKSEDVVYIQFMEIYFKYGSPLENKGSEFEMWLIPASDREEILNIEELARELELAELRKNEKHR